MNQPKQGLGSVGKHTGEIVAAATWLQVNAGKWVFESCKAAKTDSKSLWSLENWETWNVEFKKVADGEEYDAASREVARSAVEAMKRFTEV